MKTIYVDLDDVLCETTRAFIHVLKRETGRQADYNQVASFGFKTAFRLEHEEFEFLFNLFHQREEILAYEPVNDSIQVLKELVDYGFSIAIVTGRLPSSYEASLEWLSLHKIPFNSFTIINKYNNNSFNLNTAMQTIMKQLQTMNFCCAVEDSMSMAQYLSTKMKTPVALIDRPWNQLTNMVDGIQRCMSWKEIGRFILSDYSK